MNPFTLPGDVVEIGAFLGGGTYILSNVLRRLAPQKRLYTIDIFDPDYDLTPCVQGVPMARLYRRVLAGRSQSEVFEEVTRGCGNVCVLTSDSRDATLPCDRLCFGLIDGNHDPSYVKSDFQLVWNKLVGRGLLAFDDYGGDLPGVTEAIHKLVGEHSSTILRVHTLPPKTIFIQKA